MDRVTKPNNLHGLRSRSSSANSGSGCTSPARSPRPRSPSPPGSREHLSTWSASVPALNAERHFENGHCAPERRPCASKIERTLGKENDRPERPEKPERRPNSKELIEKQKNWTSHFSKTRPSRYNSDPNRSLVQTSLNSQNAQNQIQQSTSVDTYQNSVSATVNDSTNPATRSASFCSARSPPPPPPPVRNSSAAGRRERPASIAVNPSELLESPEYATVEKFDDISPIIPEYAVVQKTKKLQDNTKESQDGGAGKTQDASLPEYAVVQKNTSKTALRSTEKEASKINASQKNTTIPEITSGSKIVTSRSTESAKDSKVILQNLKSSATVETVSGNKTVVVRSVEDTKEISKPVVQSSKGSPVAEEVSGCKKNAILKPMENSRETSKNSAPVDGPPVFRTAISKPIEDSREKTEGLKEVIKCSTAIEKTAESKTAVTNEFNNDLSGQTKASPVLHYEVSSPTRSVSMDNVLVRRESDLLEAPEYFNCPPSPIHSPAKTSEWRNEWLAKNDEILKRTVDLKISTKEVPETELRSEIIRPDPRPDWARPSANAKRKEVVADEKKIELIRSPESELGVPSVGTDSASSSMSSPSSPSKDSKEEKAEKEMSEKHQTGKLH